MITHLRDPTQFLFPAAGFVCRRQTQPSCKFPSIAELMSVTNAGDNRGRGHSTNAWYGAQQPDPRIFLGDLLQAVLVSVDPNMQCHELFAHVVDHIVRDIRQIQNFASQYVLGKTDDPSEASRDIYTKFGDHSA